MSTPLDRKKASKEYKERVQVGGLYQIVNTVSGWKSQVATSTNLEGHRNRFEFGQKTNACFDRLAAEQWAKHGPESFSFVELERLEKKPEQSTGAFREELEALRALWEEKNKQ